jgi:hypothetical protein
MAKSFSPTQVAGIATAAFSLIQATLVILVRNEILSRDEVDAMLRSLAAKYEGGGAANQVSSLLVDEILAEIRRKPGASEG